MLYTAYYVIRLREDRRSQLDACMEDDACIFYGPRLFSKEQGGRTVETPKDWAREMKLLYLADLHDDFLDFTPETDDQARFQKRIRRLLGAPPWTPNSFDAWWTAEELDFASTSERIRNDATDRTFETVPGVREIRSRSPDDPFEAGRARGKIDALLLVLETRGVVVNAGDANRFRSCPAPHVLERWIRRAVEVASADAIFED